MKAAYTGAGTMVNSGEFDGLDNESGEGEDHREGRASRR